MKIVVVHPFKHMIEKECFVMKNYEKPVALADPNLAEGVFMASGGTAENDCFTPSYDIIQTPETGRNSYVIHFSAAHSASHHTTQQTLIISFNLPVVLKSLSSANGTLISGDGTQTLEISFNYHGNFTEDIALSDLEVTADAGLAVQSVKVICNKSCAQH
jgi:hypothetical protein